MRDQNQVFIFSDDEINLIKHTFADNDTLLYTVRKVLLQFPLTEVERGLIRMSITEPVWRVIKKRILPEISDEFPLGQLPSLLTTLTEQIRAKDVVDMAPLFAAKKLELDYLTQQFAVLKDIDAEVSQPIRLAELGTIRTEHGLAGEAQTNYINMHAYLFLLGYIDPMLLAIKAIAGEKKETVEQAKQRMLRDSSK
jgi:hypothetical protein